MVSVGFEDTLTFVLSGPNVATPRARDTSVTATASATGMECRRRFSQRVDRQLVGRGRQSRCQYDLAGQPGGGAVPGPTT
jgi:hypothetical protein